MARTFAIIGGTGRLGRALVQRLGAERVAVLARRPRPDLPMSRFVQGDRRDEAAVRAVLAGAEAVVDLCAFSAQDVEPLARSLNGRRIVLASSLAERPWSDWGDEEQKSAPPQDPYGLGKLAAHGALRQAAGGALVALRLPQLVALDDPQAREASYLADFHALGHARVPGDGRQRPALAPVETVADLIARLLDLPDPPPTLQIAHPTPPTVAELVEALLQGAGLPPRWQPHPDPRWRGPHSSASETVDTRRLQATLPDLLWPDLRETYRELGRQLAGLPPGPRP